MKSAKNEFWYIRVGATLGALGAIGLGIAAEMVAEILGFERRSGLVVLALCLVAVAAQVHGVLARERQFKAPFEK